MNSIDKLISIATPSLIDTAPQLDGETRRRAGVLSAGLLELLSKKNGFYAFESALHVFPSGNVEGVMDTARWNENSLWREEYGSLVDDYLFFAEDVFGDQFCINQGVICTFESETGEIEELADNFEGWAQLILDDYETLTGFPLAHTWQERYGALPAGQRLIPKIPFVLGGEFVVDNLYPLGAVKGMRLRGNLARQLESLPEGAQVKWEITDE